MRAILKVGLLLLGVVPAAANAATISCGEFAVSVGGSVAPVCLFGAGADLVGGPDDPVVALGYTLWDTTDNADQGLYPGAIAPTGALGSFQGNVTYLINPPGVYEMVLGLQGYSPSAAFVVPPGSNNAFFEFGGGLERAVLYGKEISAVPLPAAAWLLLSGIGGIAAVARRRKSFPLTPTIGLAP